MTYYYFLLTVLRLSFPFLQFNCDLVPYELWLHEVGGVILPPFLLSHIPVVLFLVFNSAALSSSSSAALQQPHNHNNRNNLPPTHHHLQQRSFAVNGKVHLVPRHGLGRDPQVVKQLQTVVVSHRQVAVVQQTRRHIRTHPQLVVHWIHRPKYAAQVVVILLLVMVLVVVVAVVVSWAIIVT